MSLPDLLTLGSRWTLVGGKGGVGKTTTAAALAISLAERGRDVLAISVDPAHSLADALQLPLGSDPTPVPGFQNLRALEIDPERERERFLGSHRRALVEVIERGTYLSATEVSELVDVSLPGVDELAALFRLIDLADDQGIHLVVDTAPTGHTLRLLDLPLLARRWLEALRVMHRKHQEVSLALTGLAAETEAAALIERLDSDLTRLADLLRDPDRTRFVLVTNPGRVVLAETRRFERALTERRIGLAGVVVNRAGAGQPPAAFGPGMVFVPRLDTDPRGVAGLRRFAAAAGAAPRPAGPLPPAADPRIRLGGRFAPPPGRSLYLVGGKGGVGKSTVAGALAVQLAARGAGRVLLLSVDPAGSLGEVLGAPVGASPGAVPGTHALFAQQLDAATAWDAFREQYRSEAEQLFAGLVGRGLSADADRRVVERLIDLAPPGIDELMTLLRVIDLVDERAYDALILDTAPTGHLLRLLELPALALEWTHMVMRLLLRYREVIGLGDLAPRLIRLSRELRSFGDLLRDPGRCWLLVVALPEALSVPETGRLVGRARQLGIAPGALLVNRLIGAEGAAADDLARELAGLASGIPCAAAPSLADPPVGPERLLRFADGWREMEGS